MAYKPVVLQESNSCFIIGEGNVPFFFSQKLKTKESPTFYMRFSQSESFDRVPVLNTCFGAFLSTRSILFPLKEVKIKQ